MTEIYSYIELLSQRGSILAMIGLMQFVCIVFAIDLVQKAGKEKLFFISMLVIFILTVLGLSIIPINPLFDG